MEAILEFLKVYYGNLVVVGIIALYFGAGFWYQWSMRHWSTFRMTKLLDGQIHLEYNYKGEWRDNGRFSSEEAAREKIEFYAMKRANRPIMPTRPI